MRSEAEIRERLELGRYIVAESCRRVAASSDTDMQRALSEKIIAILSRNDELEWMLGRELSMAAKLAQEALKVEMRRDRAQNN